ncbi:hypothetical protein [Caballeronia sp. GAWG2-1]|uniref:hypothetical protein n=1 Tax=Caballeronia sp. GAWG2-1 TaxID=2921744 RepID=UPI002028786C|nr:hypothetical protein [Caballeronia sp. GAWG2-1]
MTQALPPPWCASNPANRVRRSERRFFPARMPEEAAHINEDIEKSLVTQAER